MTLAIAVCLAILTFLLGYDFGRQCAAKRPVCERCQWTQAAAVWYREAERAK